MILYSFGPLDSVYGPSLVRTDLFFLQHEFFFYKTVYFQGPMLLEALTIHDRTLWISKLSEAIAQFKEKDQQQKIKKESGMCTEINNIEV